MAVLLLLPTQPGPGQIVTSGQQKASARSIGDPGWIQTIDLPLRRRPLYPLSYGAAATWHAW